VAEPVISDDKQNTLFEKQSKVFPKRVWGTFRKVKWIVMLVTLSIYYLTPFIRYDRGPHAPDQAVLIDMTSSRAYFFFIEIWPQEVYYLTGLLILAAISLFLVTSLFGRIWCGYACPQTVWTDLFVWVERFVQGDRVARLKLKQAPWSLNKIAKLALTHSLWIFIGMVTGGAWVFYFNDAPTLLEQIIHFNVSIDVLGWIAALTASTYVMAGFAREQVCKYMCPYARFQSAMFDNDSLIIGYDSGRGEKRGKYKKGSSWDDRGHCVDCTACVQVCPVGIDIRDGLQMECIACGLCIDACDNIMTKLELPKGLIRYDSAAGLADSTTGEKVRLLRPRTLLYVAALAIVGALILYGLINRSLLELHVLHDRNPLYVQLSDGSVRNGYDIKILNKARLDKDYSVTVSGVPDAAIKVQSAGQITPDALPVFGDSIGHFRIFITGAKQDAARVPLTFELTDKDTGLTVTYKSVFASRSND